MLERPGKNEYNAYFQRYLDLVPAGNFFELFNQNASEIIIAFSSIPENLYDYAYAPGKWNIKQILMHIIDTERVFAYRMLVAARQDTVTPLYRMDEDHYTAHADVSGRSMDSLLEEFIVNRKSTQILLGSLDEGQASFLADAVTYKVSARALAYITIGHAMHHINVLKERYLPGKG